MQPPPLRSSVGVRCPPPYSAHPPPPRPPLLKSTTIVPNVDQEAKGEGATLMHRRERRLAKVRRILNTVETAYKVAIYPRGNLLYLRIYLTNDMKLLWRGVLGLRLIYFIGDFTF